MDLMCFRFVLFHVKKREGQPFVVDEKVLVSHHVILYRYGGTVLYE